MKQLAKLTFALGIICVIAGSLLILANNFTKPIIDSKQVKQKLATYKKILPEFNNDLIQDKIEIDNTIFYPARKEGNLVGLIGETISKGYGGDVNVMVKLSPNGEIDLVIILSHNETPGIGTLVTNRGKKKTIYNLFNSQEDEGVPPNSFLDSFSKKILTSTPIQVDAVSGATISSNAVLTAINNIANVFKENKDKIINNKISGEDK